MKLIHQATIIDIQGFEDVKTKQEIRRCMADEMDLIHHNDSYHHIDFTDTFKQKYYSEKEIKNYRWLYELMSKEVPKEVLDKPFLFFVWW